MTRSRPWTRSLATHEPTSTRCRSSRTALRSAELRPSKPEYIPHFASLDPQAPVPPAWTVCGSPRPSSAPPSATHRPKHAPGTRGAAPTPPVSPPWESPNWPSTPTTSPGPSACPGPRPTTSAPPSSTVSSPTLPRGTARPTPCCGAQGVSRYPPGPAHGVEVGRKAQPVHRPVPGCQSGRAAVTDHRVLPQRSVATQARAPGRQVRIGCRRTVAGSHATTFPSAPRSRPRTGSRAPTRREAVVRAGERRASPWVRPPLTCPAAPGQCCCRLPW